MIINDRICTEVDLTGTATYGSGAYVRRALPLW
jgi:hypothetical protein